ncbi:MAG: glutamate ligase domain-containing protein, partial [Gammaproteobacteria bacterium]
VQLPEEAMRKALKEFPGLPHRCQWVRELNRVVWYNDSKGTNVGATLAAIEGLAETVSGKLILIAGGLGKGADFSPLRQAVKNHVKTLILLGQDADKLAEALKGTADIQCVNSLESAVILANQLGQSGDAVLLSPACSSLDMFVNFEHRGDRYMQLAREL